MIKNYKLTVILAAFAVISCQNKKKVAQSTISYPIRVEWSLVGKGNLLGNHSEGIESGSLWITGQQEWRDLVDKINTNNPVSDSFIENEIDFAKFDVIATFDEVRPHSGFIVAIDSVIEDARNRLVYISLRDKKRGFEMPSQPYYLIKVPKSTKTVMFQ